MSEQGSLASPNQLYVFETDPDRIRQVATTLQGMLGAAHNTRFTVCEDGLPAYETTLDVVEDLGFDDPTQIIGILSRSVRVRHIANEDLDVDNETFQVRVSEQIAANDQEGPLSIHDIILVCPHEDSEEKFSARHGYAFPTFEPSELLIVNEKGEFDIDSQKFAKRIDNSFIKVCQMTVFDVNALVELLEDVRYAAIDQR